MMQVTGTIQAKPTIYRGIRFRSKKEATWAAFLDKLGAEWEYESQVFWVKLEGEKNQQQYKPDFKIKNVQINGYMRDLYIEVKGEWRPEDKDESKTIAFGNQRHDILVVSQLPMVVNINKKIVEFEEIPNGKTKANTLISNFQKIKTACMVYVEDGVVKLGNMKSAKPETLENLKNAVSYALRYQYEYPLEEQSIAESDSTKKTVFFCADSEIYTDEFEKALKKSLGEKATNKVLSAAEFVGLTSEEYVRCLIEKNYKELEPDLNIRFNKKLEFLKILSGSSRN